MKNFITILTLLVTLAVGGSTSAGETSWEAGFSTVKITPTQPVFLAGYASRDKPYANVDADLFVKAIALKDSEGNQLVIVTSDLIGFRESIAVAIFERLHKQTGLKREQILLNSSHTHTGPLLTLDPRPRGNLSPGDVQRSVLYTRGLQDKVVQVVKQALDKMEPVKLSWGSGVVHFVMNRREFTPTGVRLGVNPRGLADRSVPVLRIDSPTGKLRAVLFGAATHGTTLGGNHYGVSGDYASFAQAELEKQYPGIQASFMLGCAGDANPYPRGTLELSKQHGKTLANEVARVLSTKLRPVKGPLRIAYARVALPLQKPPTRKQMEEMATKGRGAFRWVGRQMLDYLKRGEKLPCHYEAPFAMYRFGEDLTLVALPGEVVVDYVRLAETTLGPNKLWVTGYCNDVFGYLPSARVLREGGYETRGIIYGGIGFFSPEAENVVVQTLQRLGKQVGRVND